MKKDLYLAFVVVFQMVAVVFQLLLPIYGIMAVEQAAVLRIAITLLTFVPGVFLLMQRNSHLVIFTFSLYTIFLLFSYILYPESQSFISSRNVLTLTPIAILSALFVVSINNWSAFHKVLLWVSRLTPILAFLFVWGIRYAPLDEETSYSMSFGYAFLLPSLFLFNQPNTIDKVFSAILFLSIVMVGSRGPVVVALIFFIYKFLFTSKTSHFLNFSIVLAIVGLSIMFLPEDVDMIQRSRTVDLATSGELLSHTSGRDDIQEIVKEKILERPILGWGVGADREFVGGYSHNIFLEIFMHYGLLGGGLLFLLLFGYLLKLYRNQCLLSLQDGREFFVIMFLFGFVPMLVSGSYLYNFNFALFVGYILRFTRIHFLAK